MVRRLALTAVAAAVTVAGLLVWEVREPTEYDGKLRRLPLTSVG